MDFEKIFESIEEFGLKYAEGYTAIQLAELENERERYAPRPDSDRTQDRTGTGYGSSEAMVFGVRQSTAIAVLAGVLVVGLYMRAQ